MSAWKKGRGVLGPLQSLVGQWKSDPAADGPAKGMTCERAFEAFGKDYIRLEAAWNMGERGTYREVALFGKDEGGGLAFWSFTNDGKRSRGKLSDGSDVYPDAVAFEAQMPQGLARMIYWPAEDGEGVYFAVESRTKKGWNRFMRHRYRAI